MHILNISFSILFILLCGIQSVASPQIKEDLFLLYLQIEKENPKMYTDLMKASMDFETIYDKARNKIYRLNGFKIPDHSEILVFFLPFNLHLGNTPRSAINSLREKLIVVDYETWLTMGDDDRLILVLTEFARFWGIRGEDERYELAAKFFVDLALMDFRVEYAGRATTNQDDFIYGTPLNPEIIKSNHEDVFFISNSAPMETSINFSVPHFKVLQNLENKSSDLSYGENKLLNMHNDPMVSFCHEMIKKRRARGLFTLIFSEKTSMLINCHF